LLLFEGTLTSVFKDKVLKKVKKQKESRLFFLLLLLGNIEGTGSVSKPLTKRIRIQDPQKHTRIRNTAL